MCEKRTRKIQKGSQGTRLREARRLQRIQRMTPSPTIVGPTPGQLAQPVTIDKAAQSKVILELAWRTVALMHKNKLIQQKIIALQKETSDFVASILSNPENKQRYIDYIKEQAKYGIPIAQDYASSPHSRTFSNGTFSPSSYSSGGFSSGTFSPSSSVYSSSSPALSSPPMSPEWQQEPQDLSHDENIIFKMEPDF